MTLPKKIFCAVCPDWEIILWNENNFNIDSILFTQKAYELKKYAFVSDYVRVWALNKFGGVYLDTDVELKKPFDFVSTKLVFKTSI